ncbi:MAG: hypothetical protein JWO54_958 [Candidatus Saccharibacteria bacterium]|nr:hypothetical protein [Candidatus Saccharibacteria bacterium]MDB5181195.1 hypothetical protein [Candidatus Saccharibacteria bacterium]
MQVNFKKFKAWQKNFLSRRPHRSLKLTRRRDYVRKLELPGYIAFTHYVTKTVWSYKKLFLGLAALYLVLFTLLVGLASQESFTTLSESLMQTDESSEEGDFSPIAQAGALFYAIATVGLTEAPTEAQQVYTVLLGLLVWLTTVWLLRNKLAGHKVRLRDGLYNSGSPILPLFLVGLVLVVQLVPILIAFIAYGAANNSGLLESGVESMLFWIVASLLGLLSLFWVTSTLFAMIIVTLPGMFPVKALRSAGDLVLGRRIRILLRWLWMSLVVLVFWSIILIPMILLDLWLNSIWPVFSNVPLIPIVLAMLGTISIIWVSSYVYLLYRKVVDEHAQ